MPDAIVNNPASAMLKEVAQARELARSGAKGGATETEELPEGASPIEASAETSEVEETTPEETSEETQGSADAESAGDAPEEEPIRIAGKTFKSQAEAFAYVEQLEREKELTDAHAAGIREALEATRQPTQPEPEPEDDFEQRFYANPKEALKEVQSKARDEAIAAIRAETQREAHWTAFQTEYPDIRRKDAERILAENWETIGKLDIEAGKKALAKKVRAEYDEIRAFTTPTKPLADKKQVLSPSGGAPSRVTPKKNDDAPLSFTEQLRRMKGSR